MSRSFAAGRASGAYGPWLRSINAWIALALIFLTFAIPPARAEPITILGLGDSLMAGYGLSRGSSFPAQLEAALRQRGHDVRVINAGVSGDTSAGGKARLGWSLAEKPDAAIVELGANDGLRGLSPEAMRDNLDAILSELRSHRVPALLAGMRAPPNLGREYADAFRRVYADLAAAHGVIFYPFFLDGVAADRSLNQDDGMHPSAEGVAVVVERILPKVEELIGRVKAQRAG
ncbi:arylesterase [Thalassobaculum sp.]|uniref:arylesterase n=1 Tax=Thalassobaculum sp. TaxID=2022740 RepID=UPI0032EE1DF9